MTWTRSRASLTSRLSDLEPETDRFETNRVILKINVGPETVVEEIISGLSQLHEKYDDNSQKAITRQSTFAIPSSPANILDQFEQWSSDDEPNLPILSQTIRQKVPEPSKSKSLFSDSESELEIMASAMKKNPIKNLESDLSVVSDDDNVPPRKTKPINRPIIHESSPIKPPNRLIIQNSSPVKPPKQLKKPNNLTSITQASKRLCPIDISDPISSDSTLSSPLKPPAKKTKPNPIPNQPYTNKELNAANKTFRKKEDILSEMILNIPIQLYETFDEEFVKSMVTHSRIRKTYSTIPMIFWKRAVTADYDEERDVFIPCAPKELTEKNVVLYYKAPDLMKQIKDDTLQRDVEQAKKDLGTNIHIIIMIEGYDKYLNKLKTIANRNYTRAVLTQLNPNETNSQKKRRIEEDEGDFTVEECEYLVNKLQVDLQVNIFPVKSYQEALEWLVSFSYTIGGSLYDKFNRNESLANLGRVKPGTDKQSTFMQTIKQFNLMTTPKVEQLYSFYSSLQRIYERYESHGSLGTFGGKNVLPPTVDSAMKKVFMSEDPDAKIHTWTRSSR